MYEQIIKKNIFPNEGKVNNIKPSAEVLDLLKKLLVVDQGQRLDWKELTELPIFNKKALPGQYRVTVNLDVVANNFVAVE
jgi:hypothetical protein